MLPAPVTRPLSAASTALRQLGGVAKPATPTPPPGPGPAPKEHGEEKRKPRRQPSQHGLSRSQTRKSMRRSSSASHPTTPLVRSSHAPAFDILPNPHGNVGLQNAVRSVSFPRGPLQEKLWVGVLGTPTDGFDSELKDEVDERMAAEAESAVVWLGDDEFDKYYHEFCKRVLWPSLHYAVPDAPRTKVFYSSTSFEQYKAVNEKFAEVIVRNYREGDIIWVNDYHLFLLPQLVRSKLPDAPIGYFHHVAFPSSEIFRCLSVREQLLRGILGADLVGFQTHNFARHFRQTVTRILQAEGVPKGIQLDGAHFVDVAVFPIGIDVRAFEEKKRDPEVLEYVGMLKERYKGFKLIVGRDKLDFVQGVRQKLLAFEEFLDKYPEWQGKVVLIQVALSTTEENEQEGHVSEIVTRINSRFSTLTYQPVVFLHTEELTFSQYLALCTMADVFLVTSLREGMALRTHEFVECQTERKRPLVLSEFTGTYSYSGFRSCIAINPWDYRESARAIFTALTMPDAEAASRWEDLHKHVITQTAQAWVTSFVSRVERVHEEHRRRPLDSIPTLNVAQVKSAYNASGERLILLDLEGTLWHVSNLYLIHTEGFTPPKEMIDLLRRLTRDEKNKVYLLSGRGTADLESIGVQVPNLGLCAENGCFVRPPGSARWIDMVPGFNKDWQGPCVEILQYFAERTPGSFIEKRGASVLWRYYTGDLADTAALQWARRQAAEAQNHIFDSLGERFRLRIIPGATAFLVLPKNISRSTAVGSILHIGVDDEQPSLSTVPMSPDLDAADDSFDFILVVSSDERLIQRLNGMRHVESVSTSLKGSDAKWRLSIEEEVYATLHAVVD
ncbi:glycosyltransferase family 20 protein [Calocera cornea HHB12733]|uniref:Glycosyltransferase family 20 protein n=1 Tax=Calocera cornea HHB12733 TaxID=1353952 RepID=A0A165GKT7_9BASI|nr:glycosyltransferase family 20 protein [Calocera cornea HHB12733]